MSENGPFEVPPGRTKTCAKQTVPDATKLYVLQEGKSACLFCSFSFLLLFISDKISSGSIEMKLYPC